MLQTMFGWSIFPEAISANFLIRLAAACILGGAIGLERDIHGRAAGLRTNMLVSLGSALFVLVSEAVALAFIARAGGGDNGIRVDPGRIAAQIITGIGFLGAGAIIKEGINVRGLTTAACLWVSAGIGMACGAGLFELAIVVTLIGLFTLVVVNRLEKLYAKDSYRTLEIVVSNETNLSTVIDTVKRTHLKILYLDYERDYARNQMIVLFSIRLFHRGVPDKLSHQIIADLEASEMPVQRIKWWH
jgi:putative Mg2+ transporter-C (MgtC) family protein